MSTSDQILERFAAFCKVDLQLGERTIQDRIPQIRRLLAVMGKDPRSITREDIRSYRRASQTRHRRRARVFLSELETFVNQFR